MATRNDFHNKVVLVTGSSSGIGASIAVHLSSLGAKITITGRDVNKLKVVEQQCLDSSGDKQVLSIVADVTKDEDLKRIIDETVQRFGGLNVLINNAGIFQLATVQDDNFMRLYEKIFNTNLRSVIMLTRLAIPHLVASKGNIINVSSIASFRPANSNCAYAMSKCALDMFTKCLALELGPSGVRVNAINPAAIRTPIFNKLENSEIELSTEKMAEITSASYPLRRIGEPEDCAKAVAYLASEDASFTTGVTLLVDGGSVFTDINLPKN